MPNSTINATINGLNNTGGTTAAVDIQVAGSTVATVSSTGVTATAFTPSGNSVPTNGEYLPSANTLGFATNSTERMRIASTGGVSIGTTADPGAAKFLVANAATQDAVVIAGRAGGTSSYAVTLTPTTLSASQTLTLPDGTGTAVVNGVNGTIITGTAKAYNWNGLTTNTVLDFTGIPSWVKRVTVSLNSISGNGTSIFRIQIGSGSFVTSGYTGCVSVGSSNNVISGGFDLFANATVAANAYLSTLVLTNFSGNIWQASWISAGTNGSLGAYGIGTLTLSGALDRVRITTVNGTDVFDAGSVNILYE